MSKNYFLVKYVDSAGHKFVLQRNGKTFYWSDVGRNKEYKQLIAARRKAIDLRRIGKNLIDDGNILVVHVTFRLCNPLIPDGFYEPVETVVASF